MCFFPESMHLGTYYFYSKASFEITLQYEAVSAFTNLAMSSLRGDNKSSPN